MRPSRGMGIINPKKIEKVKPQKAIPKKITRKDDPNQVDVYKKGGETKSLDRLIKQAKGADRIGKATKGSKNFGGFK